MKPAELWSRYATKVDAASLRERVMIFAAAALALVAGFNSLLIEPQLLRQKRLALEVAERQTEIRTMQDQLQKLALARRSDPDLESRRRLEALRERLAKVDASILEEQKKLTTPEQMKTLLGEMLSRNRRLQLVDLRSLPASPLGETGAQKAPAAGAAPAVQARIFRHGLEVTVSGAYLDLVAYLRDLERQPSQVYWGRLDLNAAQHPQVRIKLTVYTLSLDLAWMVV